MTERSGSARKKKLRIAQFAFADPERHRFALEEPQPSELFSFNFATPGPARRDGAEASNLSGLDLNPPPQEKIVNATAAAVTAAPEDEHHQEQHQQQLDNELLARILRSTSYTMAQPTKEQAHAPSLDRSDSCPLPVPMPRKNSDQYHSMSSSVEEVPVASVHSYAIMEKRGLFKRCKTRYVEYQPSANCVFYWRRESGRLKGRAKCLDRVVSGTLLPPQKKKSRKKQKFVVRVCYGGGGNFHARLRFPTKDLALQWVKALGQAHPMIDQSTRLSTPQTTPTKSLYRCHSSEIDSPETLSRWELQAIASSSTLTPPTPTKSDGIATLEPTTADPNPLRKVPLSPEVENIRNAFSSEFRKLQTKKKNLPIKHRTVNGSPSRSAQSFNENSADWRSFSSLPVPD